MRNLCRIYQSSDGLCVVVPSWNDDVVGFGKTEHTTEAEWYEWATTHKIPVVWSKLADIDLALLPSREFRNCWVYNSGAVVVDPVLETAERWRRIRAERDKRLNDSDKFMLRANETGIEIPGWKTYRQSLRNLPQAQTDPKNVTWPVQPT